MKLKRLVAIVLAALMALSMTSALATKPQPDNQIIITVSTPQSFEGKTIILHSNDVHGQLDGYASIAGLAEFFRAKGAEVILTDSGDFSQGSVYVSLSKGHSAIEMMNAVGYDVVTLGNHEFDFGYDQLMENLKDAKFQTICANVTKDGEAILPASTIIETQSGIKLGFFGMETPQTASKVNPNMIHGVKITTFDSLYTCAQESVDALKEQGADLVIGLWHLGIDDEATTDGYRSVDVLDHVTGVDLVLDGHSHTVMTQSDDAKPVQSTGTKFAYVGVVVIDNATKAIEDHFLINTVYIPKDEAVAAAAQEIISAVDEKYGAAFATSEVLLNGERNPGNRTEETNLGDLICDALVWSVTKEGGLEQQEPVDIVGITNGGGIRASIEAGDVSMKDINNVLPFGNTVAVIYVTGAELLEALEASTFITPEAIGAFPQTSGIEWTIDTTVAYAQGNLYINADGSDTTYYGPASIGRVSIQSVNGQPFDPAATYAVVTNDFCAAGGDTYNVFMRAYNEGTGFDTGVPMDEAVVDYITNALDGKITAEAYGEPRGSLTIIK